MYPYASPNLPYSPVYANANEWQAKEHSIHLNTLEKVKPLISKFDEEMSPEDLDLVKRSEACDFRESSKSSNIQTANFEGNDDFYIEQYECSDDSSSINSDGALEANKEFIKNDYMSLKNESERILTQNPQYNQFYEKFNQLYRPESPQMFNPYGLFPPSKKLACVC